MALYRVYQMVTPAATAEKRAVDRRSAVLVIVAFFAVILVPLGGSTVQIATDRARESDVRAITRAWADGVVVEFILRTVVALGDNFVGLVPDWMLLSGRCSSLDASRGMQRRLRGGRRCGTTRRVWNSPSGRDHPSPGRAQLAVRA